MARTFILFQVSTQIASFKDTMVTLSLLLSIPLDYVLFFFKAYFFNYY